MCNRCKHAEDMGDLERSSARHSFGEEIFMFVKREGERKVEKPVRDKHCPVRYKHSPTCLILEKQEPSPSRLTLPQRGEWEP